MAFSLKASPVWHFVIVNMLSFIGQDRVIGILDWELSTLGNQMSDVAYSCMV